MTTPVFQQAAVAAPALQPQADATPARAPAPSLDATTRSLVLDLRRYQGWLLTARDALTAAKQEASPARMRLAADRVWVQVCNLLGATSRATTTPGIHQDPDASALLAECQALTSEAMLEVTRARNQADSLEQSERGRPDALASGEAPKTPDDTRRRAAAIATPGLCDEPAMQVPELNVCPLADHDRAAVRQEIVRELTAISRSWRTAVQNAHTLARLRPLADKDSEGIVASILKAALVAVTGHVVGTAIAAAYVTGEVAKALVTDVVGEAVETALEHEGPANVTRDDPLYQELARAEVEWTKRVNKQVFQLTDPQLVLLGERLQSHPYNDAYFDQQLRALSKTIDVIGRMGSTSSSAWEPEAVRCASVILPSGIARVAAVRPQALLKPPMVWERTGKYEFVRWIDPALAAAAVARGGLPMVFTLTDPSWVAPPPAPPSSFLSGNAVQGVA